MQEIQWISKWANGRPFAGIQETEKSLFVAWIMCCKPFSDL